MDTFLSCDWGTSSFRLRLVQVSPLQILAEENSSQGIAKTFTAWQQTGNTNPEDRVQYYLAIIQEHILALQKQVNSLLDGFPVLLSGMASSTIGLCNLPYQPLPFATNGADITTRLIPASSSFNHEVVIISGVQSTDDVMRGEETQVIGCILEDAGAEPALYILPGTHSKHIWVQNQLVTSFKTYMTGEFFELLANQSILSASIQKSALTSPDLPSFRQGVQIARNTNLLQAAFLVRTNNLFQKLDKTENFDYLSGLLIGTELRDLQYNNTGKIYLLAGRYLRILYATALQELGLAYNLTCFPEQLAEEAAVRGQYKIYKKLKETA